MSRVDVEDSHVLAYIAGFFDGEGCVSVYANGRKTSYTLRVQLVQNKSATVEKLFEALKVCFGGGITERGKVLNWQPSGDNAARFLEAIFPYLILKRDQAEVALNWYRTRPAMLRNARGHVQRVSQEQLDYDKSVDNKLREMKR